MRLWWKNRQPIMICVTVLVTTPLLAMVCGLIVSPPALAASVPTPLSVFFPLTVVVSVNAVLDRADHRLEAGARRRIALADATLVVATVVATAALWTFLSAMASDSDLFVVAARNVTGYVGLTVLAGALWDYTTGTLAAPILVIAATLLGGSPGADTRLWAWPLRPADDIAAWAIAVSLLVTGLVSMLRTSPRPWRARR